MREKIRKKAPWLAFVMILWISSLGSQWFRLAQDGLWRALQVGGTGVLAVIVTRFLWIWHRYGVRTWRRRIAAVVTCLLLLILALGGFAPDFIAFWPMIMLGLGCLCNILLLLREW
jgi:hypothetical protein